MRSGSAQRQVELRRLGNQLPVGLLGKAHYFALQNCKMLCVLPVCYKLRLTSPGRVGPGIKISRVIVARAKSV